MIKSSESEMSETSGSKTFLHLWISEHRKQVICFQNTTMKRAWDIHSYSQSEKSEGIKGLRKQVWNPIGQISLGAKGWEWFSVTWCSTCWVHTFSLGGCNGGSISLSKAQPASSPLSVTLLAFAPLLASLPWGSFFIFLKECRMSAAESLCQPIISCL